MNALPVIAAVDGSDDSLRALDWAADDARRRGAALRVAHVRQYAAWTPPGVLVAGLPEADDDPVLDGVREHLDDRADLPKTEYLALEGVSAAVLPELGTSAQLLVLGSRGRGGFASLLLGSNGMAAAREAECPVVVVPRPGREVHDELPAEPGPRVVVGAAPRSTLSRRSPGTRPDTTNGTREPAAPSSVKISRTHPARRTLSCL